MSSSSRTVHRLPLKAWSSYLGKGASKFFLMRILPRMLPGWVTVAFATNCLLTRWILTLIIVDED